MVVFVTIDTLNRLGRNIPDRTQSSTVGANNRIGVVVIVLLQRPAQAARERQ